MARRTAFLKTVPAIVAFAFAASVTIAQAADAPAAPPSMKSRMQAYFDTVNSGDVAAAAAFFAPGAVVEDPVGTPPRPDAVEFIKGVMGRGLKFEVVSPLRGTMAVAANLKIHVGANAVNAVEIYTFDATGHIAKMQAYFGPDDREAMPK